MNAKTLDLEQVMNDNMYKVNENLKRQATELIQKVLQYKC